MNPAPPKPPGRREYHKHGHYHRVTGFHRKGLRAINGRTYAGQEAKAWRAWAIERKGGKDCRLDIRQEIELATVDLWLALELAVFIVEDARKRGSVMNLRRRELPRVHEDYNTVSMRFERRREALELEKGGKVPSIREILAKRQAEANGSK
jgi:hypothetical protein